MEEMVHEENVTRAIRQVRRNHGSPGVDGMTVAALGDYLSRYWGTIKQALLEGRYRPKPVKRVEIPKPDGGVRTLGIPTVVDRFVQQLVLQVLQRKWDPTFSEHSYGFRPGRSAQQAVAQAQQYIAEGYGTVVDIDLEKFFDRVHHDRLMSRIATRVADKRVLILIRAYLNAGVMEHGLVSPTEEGTPQGGPLSPLLSNIVLDALDRELEQRVMKSITTFIEQRLKLTVNRVKSAVAQPKERPLLGFSFTSGPEIKRRIAPHALVRFKKRVRTLTNRNRGRSLEQVVEHLASYLNGWGGYFGFCQTRSVLQNLDSWISRRLRCVLWKQWKTPRRRIAELNRRGAHGNEAVSTAMSSHGPWRLSHSRAAQVALPTTYFNALGLPRLDAMVCR
ncbi:MAG: group II intron reverse transcriptase/maturase [Nitrospira sp. LK70]|nr:group II intron reverse transcriptase/maturase [Nitrospira sp. LK70]